MRDGPVLGIDLGTTNSVVAVADGRQARVITDSEGRRMVPSVVSFLPDGGTLVGYEARERRLVDAANTVYAVKRLIGRPFHSPEVARARERFAFEIVPNKHGGSVVRVSRGTYALAEISALVLRELRRVAEDVLGERCERAVITVPASFNELQRSATKAAGKVAGLDVLRILNEPTAAALAYGYGTGENERIAVYDLGGGTFDLTILELEDDVFEVLSTDGDTFLGGEDIDRALADVMCDRFRAEHGVDVRDDAQAMERLKAAAEWAKCQLSVEDAVELRVEELATSGGRALDLVFSMTRPELESLARPWLMRSFEVCDRALRAAGLTPADLDTVVLVGGATRMPLCREMVTRYFGCEPRTDVDPDLVVAQGAAIHGYALGGSRTRPLRATTSRATPRAARSERTATKLPRQPAFAPDEDGRPAVPRRVPRPARPAPPPPPRADRPPVPELPAVLVAPAVAVRTPRTTLDTTLDALEPPDGDTNDLDELAPAPRGGIDPFADLTGDDPFAPPTPGGSAPRSPSFFALEAPLDPPFAPGEKPVPSREPTVPFALAKHAPVPPKRVAASPIDADVGLDILAPPPSDELPALPPMEHAADIELGTLAPPPGDEPSAHRPPPPPPPPPPPSRRRADEVQSFVLEEVLSAPVVALPERPPPLLMDVTPHSLGIETAGGYAKKLILKNAPVPTEQTRTFTTAADDQREVVVRICQGEHDVFTQNEVLGEIVLDQLPPRPRGELTIEVAFIVDADGTLAVEARDAQTGRSQRTRIHLRGGLGADDIEGMRARQEELR